MQDGAASQQQISAGAQSSHHLSHQINQQQPPWSVGGNQQSNMNNLQFQQQNMMNMQQHHMSGHQPGQPNMNMRLQQQMQSQMQLSSPSQQMPPPNSSQLINQPQQNNMMMMQQQQIISSDQSPNVTSQAMGGAPSLPSPSQPQNQRHHHHHHHHQNQQQLQMLQQQSQSSSPSSQLPPPSPQLTHPQSHIIQQQQQQQPFHHGSQQQSFHPHHPNHITQPAAGMQQQQFLPNIYPPTTTPSSTSSTPQTPQPSPMQYQHVPQSQQHLFNQNANVPLQMQAEYRIYEMNKRLANRPEQEFNDNSISIWWESFVSDFFEEDAKMSIRNVIDENMSKNFTIGRTLIPRFFRSIYDGGVTDLYFHLTRGQSNLLPKEPLIPVGPPHQSPSPILLFESDLCTMTTKYGRPMYAIIFTEGHLQVEFSLTDPQQPSFNLNDTNNPSPTSHHQHQAIRIKNWVFTIRRHQELIPRSTIAIQQDATGIEQISKNITKAGITNHTLNYLKLCTILEPMQELMSRNKITQLVPRECLKASANQKLTRMSGPIPNHHQSRISLMPNNDDLISIKNEPGLINNRSMIQSQQQQLATGINNQSPSAIASQNTNCLTPGNYFILFVFCVSNFKMFFY